MARLEYVLLHEGETPDPELERQARELRRHLVPRGIWVVLRARQEGLRAGLNGACSIAFRAEIERLARDAFGSAAAEAETTDDPVSRSRPTPWGSRSPAA